VSDNVTITAGAGTGVATDNVGGQHYQKVKVGIGTADSAVMIGHAEDAAHSSGEGGIMALAVRNDADAALSGTDLDYTPLSVDSAGRQKIGAVTPGTAAANLGKAEDAAHNSGDTGIAVLTRRIDAAASSAGTSGDYATLDTDATGRLWTREAQMGGWTANHAPAAAAQATIAKAAAGASVKNVCTSIAVSLASAAAPTVGVVTFVLRDGATGAGTIVWQTRLSLPAVAGQAIAVTIPVWIEGTANTAMTLETTAAPPANVVATVAMTGTTL
jgi:hypothetical protein